MQKLTVTDLAQATGGKVIVGPPDVNFSGVSTDSRTTEPGDLFIPLRGERFDGHSFIAQAIERGANGIVVEEKQVAQYASLAHIPTVCVPDTLIALQHLARWHRSLFVGPVVGVTGSNGKTTTKDMVASVLSQDRRVLATAGNLNNEIGLSLTLLKRDSVHEALVVEMGMRGLGQIAALVDIAQPTIGVVTNIGPVHMELLGSIEAVTKAKRELIEGLPQDGVAILNADDPRVMTMQQHTSARILTYGLGPNADIQGTAIRVIGLEGVAFRLSYGGSSTEVILPLPGRHNVHNALAAAAVGLACGIDLEKIARGISQVQASGMRMQVEHLPSGVIVLNDAYNAAPASMYAALEALGDLPGSRKIAVLGDMLELGSVSLKEHAGVGEACGKLGVDRLITVGPLSQTIAHGALNAGMSTEHVFTTNNATEAINIVTGLAQPGDVVLVKASRGIALERIVEALKSSHTRENDVRLG